jgi:hypothetical protein
MKESQRTEFKLNWRNTGDVFEKQHRKNCHWQSVCHIGASLKDLGKKWFPFSRIELNAEEMLAKLN